jgi:hypothetical protein
MPVRLPPVTEHASRILLEGIVDYAGLFPPAALAMPGAVRNYAHYRAGGAGWMLGRFVCPADALELFSERADPLLPRDAGAIPWRLSVTASADLAADCDRIAAFNERHRVCFEECGAIVDAYEVRASSEADIQRIDAQMPRDLVTYCELPYATAGELMPALAATGRRAKLRTGGITPDAFPTPDAIVAFLRAAVAFGVPAKATAGLHHPLRGTYRLTYDDNAPIGRMYGYLNVFLAAAILAQRGEPSEAARLLNESDASAFTIDEYQVLWRDAQHVVTLDRTLLQRVRDSVLVSFGSCSFTEPVEETRALGWI